VWGVMPFVGLMFVAIILICLFPAIAIGFPNWVMGGAR
jgi:C4-dicarboxylate transporter, DctM subunit